MSVVNYGHDWFLNNLNCQKLRGGKLQNALRGKKLKVVIFSQTKLKYPKKIQIILKQFSNP